MKHLAVVILALLSFVAPVAAVETLHEKFNGPSLDPRLSTFQDNSTFTLAGGQGVFEKGEGVLYGVAGVHAEFRVLGDFEISVTASRSTLGVNGEMGLGTDYNDAGDQAAIWFVSGDRIYSAIIGNVGMINNSADVVTFRIRRVGTTVYLEYNVSGWVLAASRTDPSLAGPVRPNVFFSNGEPSYIRGSIDDLVITADAFEGATASVPVAGPAGLLLLAAALLATSLVTADRPLH